VKRFEAAFWKKESQAVHTRPNKALQLTAKGLVPIGLW